MHCKYYLHPQSSIITVASSDAKIDWENVQIDQIGHADEVIVTKKDTVIVQRAIVQQEIDARVDQIRAMILKAQNDMKKLFILFLAAILSLSLISCSGNASASENRSTARPEATPMDATAGEAPLSDAEVWYEDRTYTISEYLDLAPRIMVIDKPKFMGKNNGVDSIYIIADGQVIEKRTVPSDNIKSLAEMGQFKGNDWEKYLSGLVKITLGELAQMSEDDLWEYVGMLETVSEMPLDLHVFTDNTGNVVIGEDISDLLNFDNYMDHPQMGYQFFPVYSKYFIGYATTYPREREGYYFLSNEDINLVMDGTNSPGVAVD